MLSVRFYSLVLITSFVHVGGRVTKRGAAAQPVCDTETCHAIAQDVLSSLNASVDPCEDFYSYSCGGWIANNPIPASWSYIDTWAKLRGQVASEMKDLLIRAIEPDDIEAVRKLKTHFSACMDEETVDSRGIVPMASVFSEIGAWPLLTPDWTDEGFDLIDLLLKARRFDRKILVNIDVGIDLRNGASRIVRADQPYLGMGRDYFVGSRSDTGIPAWKRLIRDVAKELGSESETLDDDIDDLVDFAIQVANITVPSSQRRYISSFYNKMTINELSANVSDKFPWLRYIRGLFSTVGIEMTIGEEEEVMLLGREYYSRLMGLVQATPSRTVANYVMWMMVSSTISHLSIDFRLISLEFSKALYGVTTLASRSDKCMGITRPMGSALGRMFVDAYFDDPSKGITKTMVDHLRAAFNSMLQELDWMDEETKALAMEKANAMDEKIGYPDEIKDDAKLNAEFEELHFDPDKYFENLLAAGMFASVKYLKLLRVPVDQLGWTKTATTVNSYYNSVRNQITFPAGILQPPFFNKEFPNSMNYGGIGMLIGHEITHGFDDRGRRYDKNGNYVQWWSDDVIARFKNKTKCMIDQYSDYLVPEANMTLNGYLTQGENIADNGGLRQAHTAYHNWLESGVEPDFTLQGLPLNSEQLFFVGFAQVWCQSLRPETAVQRVQRSYHSPARFRVNGPLRNFKAFAEAFGCSDTAYMNPPVSETCRVW